MFIVMLSSNKVTTSSNLSSSGPLVQGNHVSHQELQSSNAMQAEDFETVREHHVYSDDDDSQVILSMLWASGKLGAAYFDTSTSVLYLMEDKEVDAPYFYLARTLLLQVDPFIVIMSSRTDERLMTTVKEIGGQAEWSKSTEMPEQLNYTIKLVPHAHFSYESSKHRLLMISLPHVPNELDKHEKFLRLSPLINFNCSSMVRAAGGLLQYLDKSRITLARHVTLLGIDTMSIVNLVNIDERTYRALQIFHAISHPSVYKTATREGLSVFGKKRLFLNPTRDVNVLEDRLAVIKYLQEATNADIAVALQNSLKGIKNVMPIIKRMSVGQATVQDWKSLHDLILEVLTIASICQSQPQTISIFNKIANTFTSDLFRIARLIAKTINFEESQSKKEIVINLGVDESLDKKKATYEGLPYFLTNVSRCELSLLDERIQNLSVVYLPQVGYMLSIPIEDVSKISSDYNIPELDFKFHTNEMALYKNASMLELDQLLGDVQFDISNHQLQIIQGLSHCVLEISHVLLDVMKYSAELDCVLSLASAAKEFNLTKPSFNNNGLIKISKGRHILQELFVSSFATNNTVSGGTLSKVKVITGPNSSGKSVYLKQVGIILYLAHIGSFVPAESADVPVLDRFFTCMGSLESISAGLSFFFMNLNEMYHALKLATPASLVLIDEFGKGTSTADGVSLLASCLKYWLGHEDGSPHALVVTHFHSLYSHLPGSPLVQYQKMDVIQEDGKVVYLYQLIDGKAEDSLACHVAITAAIPESIVSRGIQVKENWTKGLPLPRGMGNSFELKQKRADIINTNFLGFDLNNVDVKSYLTWIKGMKNIKQTSGIKTYEAYQANAENLVDK